MMQGCGGGFVRTGKAHWKMVLERVLGRVMRVMQWICGAVENSLVGVVANFVMGIRIDWSGVVHTGVSSHGVAAEPCPALVIG